MDDELIQFKRDYKELSNEPLGDEPRFAYDRNGPFKYGREVLCTILRITEDIVYNGTRIRKGRWITAPLKSLLEASGQVVKFDKTL